MNQRILGDNMKVCKFGGTSMSSADTIRRVIDIISADEMRRYIVVSAPGKRWAGDEKVTDMLISLASGDDKDSIFAKVRDRYAAIAKGLGVDFDQELDAAWQDINCADYAHIVSRGEYLMAKLLAKKLGVRMTDTRELVKFEKGELLFDKTLDNLKIALKDDICVVPGFYGSDENGKTVTFSRGGSDITGALVAAAVGADLYENWTDVDGVYSADPRKDKTAKLFDQLTYKQMYALASSGANVLHKDAEYPVELAGIPTIIKNTFNPSCKGTRITP